MNTLIEYLYRDAGNNKVWNEVVIAGEMTQEQCTTIERSLADGLYFVPELIGLPIKRFDSYDPELDHPLCELDVRAIKHSEREATINVALEEFVFSFVRNKDRWML